MLWNGVYVVTTNIPFHDMLLHNRIINNDVISPNVLCKYNFKQVQCNLPDVSRRPKHVGTTFMCILT